MPDARTRARVPSRSFATRDGSRMLSPGTRHGRRAALRLRAGTSTAIVRLQRAKHRRSEEETMMMLKEPLDSGRPEHRAREDWVTTDFRLLINGHLVEGAGTLDVINPATGRTLAVAPRADRAQLDQAVAAAKAA